MSTADPRPADIVGGPMKKPTRKPQVAVRRLLNPSELAKIRGGGDGGITALDDWESPVAAVSGNKVWSDDWLAPV
jgi:hypothetical protein